MLDYESTSKYHELVTELESLGMKTNGKLTEIENIVDNIKQNFLAEYKSGSVFTFILQEWDAT